MPEGSNSNAGVRTAVHSIVTEETYIYGRINHHYELNATGTGWCGTSCPPRDVSFLFGSESPRESTLWRYQAGVRSMAIKVRVRAFRSWITVWFEQTRGVRCSNFPFHTSDRFFIFLCRGNTGCKRWDTAHVVWLGKLGKFSSGDWLWFSSSWFWSLGISFWWWRVSGFSEIRILNQSWTNFRSSLW